MFENISNDRILIKQDNSKEGIIELRPGLLDMNLDNQLWGRVRIFIGNGNICITGMCVYSENIPEPYDLIFYTRFKGDGTLFGYHEEKRSRHQNAFEILHEDISGWESWLGQMALVSEFLKERDN